MKLVVNVVSRLVMVVNAEIVVEAVWVVAGVEFDVDLVNTSDPSWRSGVVVLVVLVLVVAFSVKSVVFEVNEVLGATVDTGSAYLSWYVNFVTGLELKFPT